MIFEQELTWWEDLKQACETHINQNKNQSIPMVTSTTDVRHFPCIYLERSMIPCQGSACTGVLSIWIMSLYEGDHEENQIMGTLRSFFSRPINMGSGMASFKEMKQIHKTMDKKIRNLGIVYQVFLIFPEKKQEGKP